MSAQKQVNTQVVENNLQAYKNETLGVEKGDALLLVINKGPYGIKLAC